MKNIEAIVLSEDNRLTLIIGASVLIFICISCCLYLIICKKSKGKNKPKNNKNTPQHTLEEIKNVLKTEKFDPEQHDSACSHCQTNFILNQKIMLTACCHAFHSKCLAIPKLVKNPVCPSCSTSLFQEQEDKAIDELGAVIGMLMSDSNIEKFDTESKIAVEEINLEIEDP